MLARLAAFVLTLTFGLPAQAQWIAAGRWGDQNGFRYVQPGTWMVLTQGSAVEMSAEAENHQGRLTFSCDAGQPQGRMVFDLYRGRGLYASMYSRAQPGIESIYMVIDGQSYAGEVEYRPNDRHWVATGILTPQFLDALAMGIRMEMLNAAAEPVTSFRLTGTGAARRVMAQLCGI